MKYLVKYDDVREVYDVYDMLPAQCKGSYKARIAYLSRDEMDNLIDGMFLISKINLK